MSKQNDSNPTGFTELLFIWISENETGFIKEKGFNFSPKYKFELNRSSDKKKYELTCTLNVNYPNIWKTDNNNTVGLTAIVGENGTGKSSLIKCILDPRYAEKWVYIYCVNGEMVVYHNFPAEELEDHTHINISVNPDASEQYRSVGELVPKKQTRIFISNTRNTMRSSIGKDNDSLDYLIFSPDENYILRKYLVYKTEQNLPMCSIRSASSRIPRDCIHKMGYVDINELILLHYYDHLFNSKDDRSILPENSIISFDFCQILESPSNGYIGYDRRAIRSIIRDHWTVPCYGGYLALCIELSSIMREKYSLDNDAIDTARELVCRFCAQCVDSDWRDYYRGALFELEKLKNILPPEIDTQPSRNRQEGIIDLSYRKEDQQQSYKDFCAYISELMKKKRSFVLRYIHIDTSPVSSGEQAMLNIFSSLHLVPYIQQIFDFATDITVRSDILLLLDEVDLYMHPDWQRQFISLLIERLGKEYPDKKIQLVLTTHSPLVLSDIPSGNIIYLSKEGNQCSVTPGPEHKETFGANIFSLLKDSFYLKKSLGEFAFSKIDATIKDLQTLKKKPDDAELRNRCREYKHMINIIGEPILKQKLQALYDELFGIESDTAYKHQLEELYHMLNTRDPQKQEKYKTLLARTLSEAKES